MKLIKQLWDNLESTVALLLSAIFFASALSKVIYWTDTQQAISSLLYFPPDQTVAVFLGFLIVTEITLSFSFLFVNAWRINSILVIIVILAFTVIAFWGKEAGLITECPCFGKLFSSDIGLSLLIRNGLIFTFAAYLYYRTATLENTKRIKKNLYISINLLLYPLLLFNIFILSYLISGVYNG